MENKNQQISSVSVEEKNKKFAKQFHLHYVNPTSEGFARKKVGKVFQYFNKNGSRLNSKNHLDRIHSLVIPPAWKDVWISASDRGHIQAMGIDARGRKQYRYHASWTQHRNEKKFTKMIQFVEKLPVIRKHVQKHLKEKGLSANKVLASVISIMQQTLIRVGNEQYAKENHSYGLTTIHNKHVKVGGNKIVFDFIGKSGKHHHVELKNPQLAEVVRACQELPGQELFGYRTDAGEVRDLTSTDVNLYLHQITGESITAKDFRTWGGTVQAALFLKDKNPPPSKKEMKKILVEAVLHTSSNLRNTPAVCRKYYIHPLVFQSFEDGKLKKLYQNFQKKSGPAVQGLSKEELFTKKLLQSGSEVIKVQDLLFKTIQNRPASP